MNHIVMLLSNPFRPDPRVLKEASSLAEIGYDVTILCWDRTALLPEKEILTSGVKIHRIQNVRSSYGMGARQITHLIAFWRQILTLLDDLQPDIVHCHDFDTLPAGLWWRRRNKVPIIYDAHEHYAEFIKPRLYGALRMLFYRVIRWAEYRSAQKADAVITVDETLANMYQIYNSRVLVIGHYPPRHMAQQPSQAFQHAQLRMIYAGRLSIDRGLLLYPDILRSLLGQGVPAHLHLVGVFTPQNGKQQLLERCAGLEENIQISNWVAYDDIPTILKQADLGLSILMPEPRYVAAVPVKLFDYMAAGLPTIASDFPAVSKIIHEKRCGVTVNPLASPKMIAAQIAEMWAKQKAARQMGENGRQAILDQYNWETLVGRLGDLYNSLLV